MDPLTYLDAKRDSFQSILDTASDPTKYLVVENACRQWNIDIEKYLLQGGNSMIKVQSYDRFEDRDKAIRVRENEADLISIRCSEFYRYFQLCNANLNEFLLPISQIKSPIYFRYFHHGKQQEMEIDIFLKILYAVDIPLKRLSNDLFEELEAQFQLHNYFLPGKKYCYLQFVSGTPARYSNNLFQIVSYFSQRLKGSTLICMVLLYQLDCHPIFTHPSIKKVVLVM